MTQRRYRPLIGGLLLLAMIGVISVVLIGFARDPDAVSGGPVPTRPPTQDPAKIMPATLPSYLAHALTPVPLPAVMPTPHAPSIADGVRGITPRTTTIDPQTPTYTEQDVRDYIASRGIAGTAGGPTLVNVAFQTAANARQTMGGGIEGFPNDTLVCVVQLNGSFTRQSKTATGPGSPVTLTKQYYVFDGHTGNLLMIRTAP